MYFHFAFIASVSGVSSRESESSVLLRFLYDAARFWKVDNQDFLVAFESSKLTSFLHWRGRCLDDGNKKVYRQFNVLSSARGVDIYLVNVCNFYSFV